MFIKYPKFNDLKIYDQQCNNRIDWIRQAYIK